MAKINALELAGNVGVAIEPPLLTPDQKMALGVSAPELEITKVIDNLTGEHGDFWQFWAKHGNYTFRFNMSDPMQSNASDDVKAQTLALYTAIKQATDNGDTVEGIVLNYVEWKGGNSFFKLDVTVPPTFDANSGQPSLPF